tara:strand:- start:6442 stop:7890 length:1449 start_codon:yes stop_codon:yes gene_type:complete
MALIPVAIAEGFYEDSVKPIASQECVNYYPYIPEATATTQAALKPTAGLSLFATNGNKVNRGAHVMNSVAFFVNGNALYRVNADGASDSLGTISGSGSVSMADNGAQLCVVVPDSTGYIFTSSPDTLTEITDTDYFSLGPSKQVVYKDGYFVHISDSKFFNSALNDGLVYGALDFGTAEVDPDNNTAIHVNRNILYIGGNETIEPFQNVGGSGFPFSRIQGGVIQKGIKAKFSVIDFDNSFVFLGGGVNEQPAIWRFTGASAVKLSTPPIDNVIGSYTSDQLDAVYSTSYAADGAFFVCFHFPLHTFCYDATASARYGKPIWHQRKSRDSNGSSTAWRVASLVQAYGKTLAGDTLGAKIGHLTKTAFTEYDTLIDRGFSGATLQAEGVNLFVSKLELFLQSGTGTTLDPTQEPLVTMSFSKDGGITWGNELSRKIGKIGEYGKRQTWKRLGRFPRYATFKFSISGEIDCSILKLTADITGGQ